MSAALQLGQPALLALAPAVIAVAAGAWWLDGRRRRRLAGLGVGAAALGTDQHRGRARWRLGLQVAGLLLVALAAAQPRWGLGTAVRGGSGYQIAVVLDCSRSMLAQDYYPDRSRMARNKATRLLELQREHRIAVIPFASSALLRVPLIGDHEVLQDMLEQCDPALFTAAEQGTSIGRAVTLALQVLNRAEPGGRAVLVMSDGGDPDAGAVARAAREARAADIPVYGLLVGDAERRGSIRIGDREQPVPPDPSTLQRLADETGAAQVTATDDDSDLRALLAHMDGRLARQAWRERSRIVAAERYQWLLLPGLLLIAAGLLLGTRRAAPRSAVAVLLLASLLGPLPSAESAPSASAPLSWPRLRSALAESRRSPEAAIAALRTLATEEPQFHAARYALGTLLLPRDAGAAAEHLLAATNAADAETVRRAWYNLAQARHRQGRADDAARAAAEALNRAPDDADTRRLHHELRRLALEAADAERLANEAAARRLRLPAQHLPEARVGRPYAHALSAAGGSGRYRFRDDAPQRRPAWLALDPNGRLHGTPPAGAEGELPFAVAVDDGAGSASAVLQLRILPPPAIVTLRLDDAVVGIAYRATLVASGVAAGRWRVDGLPPGLALTDDAGPEAVISGTPSAVGEQTLRIAVSDDGASASASLPLRVVADFAIDAAAPPPATVLHAYRHQLGIRGPEGSYRFSATPLHGLSVDAQGRLSGTPLHPGIWPLPVSASDSSGRSASATILLEVRPAPNLTGPAQVEAQVGRPLDTALELRHGSPPFAWSVAEGALPAGLELADGRLRGVPGAAGERRIVVAVTDRWGASDRQAVDIRCQPATPPTPQDGQQQQQQQQQQAQSQQQQQAPSQQQKQSPSQGSGKPQRGDDRKPADNGSKQGQESRGDQQAGGAAGQQRDAAGGKDGQGQGAAARARAAAELDAAAARRWLDNLPPEDRAALRQLLLAPEDAPPPLEDRPQW